jgi:hypothetical protein
MTAITPGIGGTLKAPSAEGQLLELSSFIRFKEQLAATNPNSRTNLTVSYNFQTFAANMTFSMPAAPGINASGQAIITAIPYLVSTGFTAGTGGTFKSTTPEAYLLELVTYLQIKEADASKNPTTANNISADYSSDDNIFSGNATMPFIASLDTNGHTIISADEYLKD